MDQIDDKPVSKQTLYQIASRHSRAAIEKLVQLLNSSNENVALGAAKTLLSKTLPDLKKEDVESDINLNVEVGSDQSLEERLQNVLLRIRDLQITSEG